MRTTLVQLIALFVALTSSTDINRQKRGLVEVIDHEYGYGTEEGAILAPTSGLPVPNLEYGVIALVSSPIPADAPPVQPEAEAVGPPHSPIYTEEVVPSHPFIIQSEGPTVIEREIPVPVPIRVPTTIKRTLTVAVPLRIPYPIPQNIPVPVPQPYPYFITKKVPFEVPRPYPVPVVKEVPVPVKQPYPVPVPVPQNVGGGSTATSSGGYGSGGSTIAIYKSH